MPDSLPIESYVNQQLERAGEVYEVGGNTPFLLNVPNTVWCVICGTVEVFTVRVVDGEPSGARYHFLTAKTGDLLFGMDLDPLGQSLGFLCVGVVGTKVCKLPLEVIQGMTADSRFTEELSRRMERWVAGLSHGITKSIYPHPRVERLIDPGDEIVLKEGEKTRARKGIVWLHYLKGASLFISMEEVSLPQKDALFPVSNESWIQAISATQLEAMDTKAAFAQERAWEGLEAFYDVLLKCEFFNTTLAAVDEYNRLKRKAERDEIAREESLEKLASIMHEERHEEAPISFDDPLFSACTAIGSAAGIRFVQPPGRKEGQTRKDPLGDIAKASHIRMRPVILSHGWWKKDNGPLLAYAQEGNHPVALLPTSSNSYELFDSVRRVKMPVTDAVAQTLAETAVTFYRSFPNQIISLRDLLSFGGFRCWKDLRAVILMGVSVGLLALVTPIATGTIFDSIVPEAERGQLLQICLALLVSAIAAAFFSVTQSIAVLRLEGKFDYSVNAAIIDRLLSLPVPFFRRYSAGDLASRAAGISEIRRLISGTVLLTLISSAFSLISFALLFYYDVRLALIATVITVFVVGITFLASVLQLRYQRKVRDFEGKIAGIVLQMITGISKLRVAGAEGHAFAYWAKEFASQKKMMFRARTVANHLIVFNSALPVLSSAIIFASLALQPQGLSLSTGDFLAFNAAFTQFLLAALLLSTAITMIQGLVPIYERAQPILQNLPEVDEHKAHPGELNGEIELSHVSFRYEADGPLILKDVSLQIHPGEFVAIVGPSGTGKSTLFRLLLGFEKPERGSIHYDGQDVAVLDIQEVRRQIGVVLQQSRVMTGDIYHNIVGAAPLTVDDAWEAARKAGIDEDIKLMPMGMHTVVSEGGSTFSGGQRQRILIARAIVNNPRILLFDEATSALDNRTQANVSESLQKLQATRIVIAHRLSTIRNADRIFVFDNGRIVQNGTYQELMNQSGLFVELAKRQLS